MNALCVGSSLHNIFILYKSLLFICTICNIALLLQSKPGMANMSPLVLQNTTSTAGALLPVLPCLLLTKTLLNQDAATD